MMRAAEQNCRQAVLLGNSGTKRTDYFMQAAAQAGLPVIFTDWKAFLTNKSFEDGGRRGWFVKIDPPRWDSCRLTELNALAGAYQAQLRRLEELAEEGAVEFFNHPSAIAQLLDKRLCKETLKQAGIPVTEQPFVLEEPTADSLFAMMSGRRVCQVFIKPVYGSGAAGVSALRWQPSSGRMALYTCALMHPEFGLVNTKRLRRFSKPEEVVSMLGQLLKQDCIIEKWHAKADYQGASYDIRAVVQDGHVDFMLARLSKGPITNLQLNNRPLELEALGLPASVPAAAADLCSRAAACFPKLRSAGIDILLEKGSLRPRIIEMNAQGDLIYQDIYHENIIYRRQVQMIQRRLAAMDI